MKQHNRLLGLGVGAATLLVSGLLVGFTGSMGAPPPPTGQIAFVSNRHGNLEVYTMNSNGSSVNRLTTTPQNEYEPAWFGDKIAFTSFRDSNYEVYVMNEDGSGPINLTNDAAYDFGSTWSPNGLKIAFASDRAGNSGNFDIFAMDPTPGAAPENLTNSPDFHESHPAWSPSFPDGSSKIAFTSNLSGNDDIYVMGASGGVQVNLTNNSARDRLPAWSPDGTKIAFTSNRHGNDEIYVIYADGTGVVTRLTNNSAEDAEPAWSSDGRITFWSHRGRNYDIYVMNADGSGVTRLTKTSANEADPVWRQP